MPQPSPLDKPATGPRRRLRLSEGRGVAATCANPVHLQTTRAAPKNGGVDQANGRSRAGQRGTLLWRFQGRSNRLLQDLPVRPTKEFFAALAEEVEATGGKSHGFLRQSPQSTGE